ncbi:tol-pal system YbgF family protein [Chitinophaga sp. sic0106]|uniref:tetratricopeptide repeat protein n=1 Tax=Chitinophaga sp. sic0106 TaxID=2854785 RepID=UPI001C438B27|nr:hypothetical protein [Chitinophaga sp. sic0106]MBV7533872.1 hypothetical protein [Chitinophaga sp. sic0106]
MTPESLTSNEQDYINGLLHHEADVIDSIYQRFAIKAQRFIQQKGGTVRDAAHIFEEVLLDIYFFVRRHPLKVASFEAFLILLCKRVWEKEVERRGGRIPGLEADETAALSREDMQDLEYVLKEGEKRRVAYHQYLQLGDDCKELIRWALTDCLQEDIAAETKIPVKDLPTRRASCFKNLLLRIDGELKPVDSMLESEIQTADAYLCGIMSEAARNAYTEKLKTNTPLANQVKRFDLIRQLLAQRICTDTERDELQHQLYAHRNTWFAVKDSSIAPIRNYVIGTAIIAITLATLLYISPWRKNIYSQFSSTEMHAMENDTLGLSEEVKREFNRGHFSDALRLLNQELAANPDNIYARYYRGVSLVDLNQLAAARQDLLTVYNGDNKIRYEAAFYLALSYLKEGHKQECLEWLLKIPEGAPNYLKVQKLIEELKA